MTWILRVLIFIHAFPLLKSSPTIFKAKENDNITIEWDIQTKTDIDHVSMIFIFLSDTPKVLYRMVLGHDTRPHQQFARRVECDKVALREGRVTLHLFRVSAEDSGNYTFELDVTYPSNPRKSKLKFELFVLNITSDGANTHLSGNTPGQARSPDAKDHPRGREGGGRGRYGLVAAVVATCLLVVVFGVYHGAQAQRCNIYPWIT